MSKRDLQSHAMRYRQHGLTLVEMMVAVTIAALLLAGTVQIFISSKRTYRTQEALSRLQENGRYAMQLLTTDIRQAGNTGCYKDSLTSVQSIVNGSNYAWDYSDMVVGYEANGSGATDTTAWTPTLDSTIYGLSPTPNTDSDVITIRYMASDGLDLVAPYTGSYGGMSSSMMFVDQAAEAADPINIGDIIMVTDCSGAAVAQINLKQTSGGKVDLVHSNSGTVSPGNSTPTFAHNFGAGSQVARLVTHGYYIGTDSSGLPALYRTSGNDAGMASPDELVQGVRDMQIEYGFRGSNSSGYYYYYVPAATGLDMSKVVSVRIKLLVESIDDHITASPMTYTFDGTSKTASDHRLYQEYTTTIALRNRT